MTEDFPAAHSMDSAWFGVDQNGNVAHFLTGAGGAIPSNAYAPEAEEILDEGGEGGFGEIPELLQDENRLFLYATEEYDECFADRYLRKRIPKNPLHIDELPPHLRDQLNGAMFDKLSFKSTDYIQPVEWMPCVSWDPAYLTSDGISVRPVPGMESAYEEFVEGLDGIGEWKIEPVKDSNKE